MSETQVGHTKRDSTDIYIGRGRNGRHLLSVQKPGKRGWLGNPFTLEEHTRDESVDKFETALKDKLSRSDEFREAVKDLGGKTLGCWCRTVDDNAPRCHGDVIKHYVKLLNEGDE